ncbi:MAG: hypothetical protein OCD01_08465 [Fibrobacterales bacterium]
MDNSINKILPLGASRVEGDRPVFESFRYQLWKALIENNWTFDFIGTQTDRASYPSVNGNSFDGDHEGRSGWTSEQILNGLTGWLSQIDTPDIVLFSSPGGNDGILGLPYAETIANINSIIDVLQAGNQNVTIVIEQMAPGQSYIMTLERSYYIIKLQQDVVTIAAEQSTALSQVITVNMYTDFTDALLADYIHYNEAGATFIANRYYDVLEDVLEK